LDLINKNKMKANGIKSAVTTTGQGLWTRMPLWAKGIIVVGGVYVAYKLGKNLLSKTRFDPITRDSSQELDGWNNQYIRDNAQNKATLSPAEMKAIANSIFRAMDGYGTDEDSIISDVKKCKNNADWSGVNAAWGKRTISSGNWNPAPNLSNATLSEAITDEMSQYWKDEMNKHLSKVGITYRA